MSRPCRRRSPERLPRSSARECLWESTPGSTANNNTTRSFPHCSTRMKASPQRHRRSALEMIIFLGRELISFLPALRALMKLLGGQSRSRDVFVIWNVTRVSSAPWRRALFLRRSQSVCKVYGRRFRLRRKKEWLS